MAQAPPAANDLLVRPDRVALVNDPRNNPPQLPPPVASIFGPGASRGPPTQKGVYRKRRRKMAGFSRRSFKFLRWLYHNRKRRRFTPAQQQNAARRREVFYRAWVIARNNNRRYLTGQDVMAAQGSVVNNVRNLQEL